MFEILFYFVFWEYLQDFISIYITNDEVKLTRNCFGLFHALFCCGFYLLYYNFSVNFVNDFYYFSYSYFLYDCYFMLYNYSTFFNRKNISNLVLLCHHAVALFFLNKIFDHGHPSIISYALYLGELSNIPGYFSYYFIKTKNSLSNISVICQTFIYAYVRIICMGNFLLYANDFPLYWVISFLLIYTMGVFWSFNLLNQTKQIIKNIYN